ncbi:MAG: peptidase [Pseudomonadota bacterium]
MTYCVALRLNGGLIFMSDTRTNAGVDNISTVKKMFTWNTSGERTLTLMTAGNLATTQAVISLLEERTVSPDERQPAFLAAPTMFQVARLIGETLKEVIRHQTSNGKESEAPYRATIILGGQIRGMTPRLFLIYPEGNFIEATDETPFFQSGEMKYGRPILLRCFDPAMSFEQATKLLCLSFDPTLRANLGVGMPLDLMTYAADSFTMGHQHRFEDSDPYFHDVSARWRDALKTALDRLPDYPFTD